MIIKILLNTPEITPSIYLTYKMFDHKPVLLSETIELLQINPQGNYIDCTFGCGGHAQAILNHLDKSGQLIAFDRDPASINYAHNIKHQGNFNLITDKFSNLERYCIHMAGQVDGILFDLGPSSPQLDTACRGFSFKNNGPLDMRMNPEEGATVLQIIKTHTVAQLTQIIGELSDEKRAYKIAKKIKEHQHSLKETQQLAKLIKDIIGKTEKKHPATRSFQALRIYVNQEIKELTTVLPKAYKLLKPNGIMCVISFHSIEDRVVKRFMQSVVRKKYQYDNQAKAEARWLARVVRPQIAEVLANRRSRSAILRVIQKIS